MPRFEIRHPDRTAQPTGSAAFALLVAVVPSVILASCGLDYGSAGPSGTCGREIHATPATLRIEVERAAWVVVRDGPGPDPANGSHTQDCANVEFGATPNVTFLYGAGGVFIVGMKAGQTSVDLLIAGSRVATIPVVVAPASAYQTVSVGGQHICGLTDAGSLYCAGSTGYFLTDSWWPARIPLIEPLVQVASGFYVGCGIAVGGMVYCWGQRPWGTNQPVLGFGGLTPPSQLPVGPAQSVGVGESFGCALTLLRRVECWGLSGLGSLGVPGNTSGTFMIATVPTPENMTAIAVGQGHACALDGEGRAWCWGRSGEGQLGTTQEDQACGFEDRCLPTPASVAGDLRLAAIAAGRLHTCAIAIDGAAWCWGSNHMGQLGTGDLLDSREPRRVALGLSFTALALGSHHSCGLTGVGAIYCWGRGKEGELGDGMFTELSSTPVRVQGSAPFRSLSAGGLNTCAVQVNGPVMCWGDGTFNQLGRGSDQAAASTPTKWSGQP